MIDIILVPPRTCDKNMQHMMMMILIYFDFIRKCASTNIAHMRQNHVTLLQVPGHFEALDTCAGPSQVWSACALQVQCLHDEDATTWKDQQDFPVDLQVNHLPVAAAYYVRLSHCQSESKDITSRRGAA